MNLNPFKIFNAFNARPAPAPAISTEAPPNTSVPAYEAARPGGNLAKAEARNMARVAKAEADYAASVTPPAIPATPTPQPEPDAFRAKFGKRPYYQSGINFEINLDFLQAVCKRAGQPLVTEEEKLQLLALAKRWDEIQEAVSQVTHTAAQKMFERLHEEHCRAITEGRAPSVMPDRELIQKENDGKRRALRGEMQAIGIKTAPLLAGICKRLEASARTAAELLYQDEVEIASEWHLDFMPSFYLAAVVWLAMEGAANQASFGVGNFSSPRQVLFGVLEPHNHAH